jgi:hypothetical protein
MKNHNLSFLWKEDTLDKRRSMKGHSEELQTEKKVIVKLISELRINYYGF